MLIEKCGVYIVFFAAGGGRGKRVEISPEKPTIIESDEKEKSNAKKIYLMIVGLLTAQLYMHGITSLKEKRGIVKSVIGRLKSRFNISIAEVDHQDNKTSAVVAIVMVSNDTRFIDRQFDAIINFMQRDGRFYLGKIERETF